MCKIHGYHYACGHFIRYRLSSCRGTYTKLHRGSRPRDEDDPPPSSRVVVACTGECYLIIASRSLCGSCQHSEFKRQWDARIGEAETAYCRALDRGNKAGIGVWGWAGSGGGDDDSEDEDEDEDDEDEDTDGSLMEEDDDDDGRDGGRARDKDVEKGSKRRRRRDRLDEKRATREEINHCSRVLEDLRADFSVESWEARKRFPLEWRNIYLRPKISKRVPHGSSPLRCEVRPEDVVLRGREADGDGGEGGGQRYKTFQAFFVDTYSGVTEMPSYDYSAEIGGEGWTGEDGSATTQAGNLTTTGCWDAGILANINMANSLKEEENDPSGEKSYYTEYERFNVSTPEKDDQEVDDIAMAEPAIEEERRGSEDFRPTAHKPMDSLIAYGPKASLSSLSEKLPLEHHHLLARGPEAAPS